MAGAFVGVADDASAIFHNPAGLAFLPDGTVNTSLWATAYERQDYASGFATPLSTSALASTGFRSLPVFLAGSVRPGTRPGDPDHPSRTRRHVFAFAVLSPFASSYGIRAQQQGSSSAGESAAARVDVTHDEFSQWYGVSYAYLASARASFGVSLFASHWNLVHQETQLRAAEGITTDLDAGELQSVTVRLQRRLVQLTMRLGGMWRPHPEVQLGLMLQPPGPNLYGSVSAEGLRAGVSGVNSQLEPLDVAGASVSPLTAWEVRTGAALGTDERGIVSLDASVIGPDSRTDVPQAIADWTGVDAFPMGTNVQPTLRGAVGYALLVNGSFPVRGGLLGEYTIASSEDDLISRVSSGHAFGAALSVGHRFTDFDLSFGVTGELATSRLLRPDYADEDTNFLPTDVRRTTLFFYLSGGSKAAQLVKRAVLDAL